jgi:hypothetical protein
MYAFYHIKLRVSIGNVIAWAERPQRWMGGEGNLHFVIEVYVVHIATRRAGIIVSGVL